MKAMNHPLPYLNHFPIMNSSVSLCPCFSLFCKWGKMTEPELL